MAREAERVHARPPVPQGRKGSVFFVCVSAVTARRRAARRTTARSPTPPPTPPFLAPLLAPTAEVRVCWERLSWVVGVGTLGLLTLLSELVEEVWLEAPGDCLLYPCTRRQLRGWVLCISSGWPPVPSRGGQHACGLSWQLALDGTSWITRLLCLDSER